MPWKETCRVEERVQFVLDAQRDEWSMADLCRAYGVSRKSGYKWLARYQAEGIEGLMDRSRARHTQPHAVSADVREMVIEARRAHRTWGPKKLRPWLERRHPNVAWPSLTTMASILRDAKLVTPTRHRRRLVGGEGGLGGDGHPNGVWATDFKGQFRLGDGRYCYPLTVTDVCTRFLLDCRAQTSVRGEPVRESFVRLFREYGVPDRIRSDNGSPFASRGAGRLTKLAVSWLDQGIALQRITPGQPQQNGRHERMHLTLKQETATPPAGTMRGQQRRFNSFRREYNEDRPHEALNQSCPSEHYEVSARPYDPKPAPPEYPAHYEVRSVRREGCIKFRGTCVYLSEALIGRRVGLVETADGMWRVMYRHHPLGSLDERAEKVRITPLPTPAR